MSPGGCGTSYERVPNSWPRALRGVGITQPDAEVFIFFIFYFILYVR